MRRPSTIAALVAFTAFLAACGGDQSRGGEVVGDTLTIYSSMPLQGPQAERARSIINAEKLALKEAGGRAGSFKINFASRDDATAGESEDPGWSAGRTADNASKAAQDSRTIAYLGELDSGATAVSIPITNEAGFAQVSPASSSVGLTQVAPGADKGEPDKYYPSGERSFARVVPADDVQASAAARWARQLGARRAVVVDDKTVQGRGLVDQFRITAERTGLQVADRESMDPRADDYEELVREIAEERPDLVYFGGGVESNAVRLWRQLGSALPRARLMGAAGLLVPSFVRELGPEAARTYLTSVAQDPSELPPRGRRFVRDYRREFGAAPDPYAAYGHAAMSLVLDAVRRAGDDANRRDDVVEQVLDTRDLETAVGTFSIDENGDTTLDRIAGYRVRGGRLDFAGSLRGAAGR